MRVKKSFPIFAGFIFLAILIMAPVQVSSSPSPVTVVVEMPEGYPAKPYGTKFWVTFLVEADDLEYNGSNGMIFWALFVKVDPTVLKPFMVNTSVPGYFLYDFADQNFYAYPKSVSSIDETTGLVEVAEMYFAPLPPGGAATDPDYLPAPYKLVSIAYEVVGPEWEWTSIDIQNPRYTVLSDPDTPLPMIDADGWYGWWYPYHTLTVESSPIDRIKFSIDWQTYTTNRSVSLLEGFHNVAMPSTWMVDTDQYNFKYWEDGSTDPVRIISLTADKTIIATYEQVAVPEFPIGLGLEILFIPVIIYMLWRSKQRRKLGEE